MCTALAPRIGYDAAAAVAKKAAATGRNVREVVLDLVGKAAAEVEVDPRRRARRPRGRAADRQEEVEQLLDPTRQTHRGTGA